MKLFLKIFLLIGCTTGLNAATQRIYTGILYNLNIASEPIDLRLNSNPGDYYRINVYDRFNQRTNQTWDIYRGSIKLKLAGESRFDYHPVYDYYYSDEYGQLTFRGMDRELHIILEPDEDEGRVGILVENITRKPAWADNLHNNTVSQTALECATAFLSVHPHFLEVPGGIEVMGNLGELFKTGANLTPLQGTQKLFQICSRFMDSHTYFDYKSRRFLPFILRTASDGYYIEESSGEYKDYLGYAITSINGVSIAEISLKLADYLNTETDSLLRDSICGAVENAGLLELLSVIPFREKLELGLINRSGNSVTIEAETVNFNLSSPAYYMVNNNGITAIREHRNYSLYYHNNGTLILRYDKSQQDSMIRFSDFLTFVDKAVTEHSPQRFVLDLSRCRGGSWSILLDLIDYLKESDFFTNNQIYTVIGPATFSAGVKGAMDMRMLLNSHIVGEPSGGMINHYGVRYTMPLNLIDGLELNIAREYFPDYPTLSCLQVMPDIAVEIDGDYILDLGGKVIETIAGSDPANTENRLLISGLLSTVPIRRLSGVTGNLINITSNIYNEFVAVRFDNLTIGSNYHLDVFDKYRPDTNEGGFATFTVLDPEMNMPYSYFKGYRKIKNGKMFLFFGHYSDDDDGIDITPVDSSIIVFIKKQYARNGTVRIQLNNN